MSVFNDQLVGQSEVISFTTLSRFTLARHIKGGLFPKPIKQGGKLLWRESQIKKWLAEKEEEAQTA